MSRPPVYRATLHRPQYTDPLRRYFHGAEAEGDATRWLRDLTGPPGTRWQLERLENSTGETIDRGRIE